MGVLQTPSGSTVGQSYQGAAMKGRVNGGQNPVSGAKVYLYAAGNSAAAHNYGTGATSLLTSAVLTNNTSTTDASSATGIGGQDANGLYYVATDAHGAFNISSDYACPAAMDGYPAEVYLLAIGGDSGSGANSSIALMAALGPCTSASALAAAVPFVQLNEVTTVAAVWALQQFMAAPSGTAGSVNIGAPTTNLVGMQNAFTTATNLADVATGLATPVSTNTWVSNESDREYTLADILSYCVNAPSISSSCSDLFASVIPSSTTLSTKGIAQSTLNAPMDTIQAAWYLAQFPTNIGGTGSCGSTGAAFACIQGVGAPFIAMSSSPPDWTLAVGYAPVSGKTAYVNQAYSVAADFYGNVWVSNYKLGSVVAVGPSGNAMMTPITSYTVGADSGFAATLSSYGITSSTAPAYTRTISSPRSIVIDSSGNAWLADWNGSYTNEVAISSSSYCGSYTSTCYFGQVAEFPAAAGPGATYNGTATGYYSGLYPFGAAADASGNVYFTQAGGSTNPGSKVLGKFNASGAYTVGASIGTHPYTVIVDNTSSSSATNAPLIWVNDQSGCTATAGGDASVILQILSGSLATNSSYNGLIGANTGCSGKDAIAANTGAVMGMAVDSANNLWLANAATEFGSTSNLGTTGATNTVTYGVRTIIGSKALISTTAGSGSVNSASGAGGLSNPQFLAIDGANNAWVANLTSSAISEFSVSNVGTTSMAINALSGSSGYTHAETGSAITGGEGIAIDLSGNVWIANFTGGTTYLTVLVGAATPAAPVIPGMLGVAP
ncbi:MAG: hypothetical protein PW792_08140 [Acidobacteriaceae bacterium]|nr:hypothetical protein [Acidobacteriaceae bacterium]